MPVFDFNSAPEDKKEVQCTYTTFCSNEDHATPECPILVLDNQNRKISWMVMPFTESVRSHLEAEQNYLLRTASFSL